MTNAASAEEFWERYVATLPVRPEHGYAEAFQFGPTAQATDSLASMVVWGMKTARAMPAWELEALGKPLPAVGEYRIVLRANGVPACIIETTEVRVVPFGEVDAEFVREYGEGDRSLEFWRGQVWEAFTERCAAIGREASLDMPVVCERFRRVFRQ